MKQRDRTGLGPIVRTSLQKLFVTVALVIIALGAVLTWRSINTQNQLQAENFFALGRASAQFLASRAHIFLLTEDLDEINKLLLETRKTTPDCAYVAIVARSGEVLAAEPPDYTPSREMLVWPAEEHQADVLHRNEPTRHFVQAVQIDFEAPKHFAYLGLSRARLEKETAGFRDTSVLLTLFMTLIGLILVGVTARAISRRTHETAASIAASAQQLKAAAEELFAVAQHAEANAADEASAVDETRRTMGALLDASNRITEGARTVFESAERSAEASTTIAERISTLNKQALKIGDVSETIRAIADKSDILALNASLEGAKAGEIGRGFVLVGAEMRRLAETVTGAVRQIKQLADEIRELSQSAVLATEEGQKLAVQTREVSEEISLITQQQRTGTEQVSQSMEEILQFTQQALSGAKQSKSTADELASTARELTDLVEGASKQL